MSEQMNPMQRVLLGTRMVCFTSVFSFVYQMLHSDNHSFLMQGGSTLRGKRVSLLEEEGTEAALRKVNEAKALVRTQWQTKARGRLLELIPTHILPFALRGGWGRNSGGPRSSEVITNQANQCHLEECGVFRDS